MIALYLIAALVGLPLFAGITVYLVKHPKVWLGFVLLLLPLFLADTGIGLSVSEAVTGGFILSSILCWVFFKAATGYSFIQSWADVFLIAFLLLSCINAVPAVLNDVPFDQWISEWMLFLLLLYYFPLREYFGGSNRELSQLLIICSLAIIIMAGYTGYDWVTRSNNQLVYAYQLIASRSRLFAPVFSFGLTMVIAIYYFVRTTRMRLYLIALGIINLLGLVQSVTRSLWLMFIVSTVLTMCFFSFRQNFKLIMAACLIAAIAFSTASFLYPRATTLALKLVSKRMSQGTLRGGDHSFETRVYEAESVWKEIKRYPLSGSGIRAQYVSWDPIEQKHSTKPFVHIGFISIVFKMGIGLSVLLLSMLIAFSIRSAVATMKGRRGIEQNGLAYGVALGTLAFQPTLYGFITVAGIFDQRYGNAIFMVMFALVSIALKLTQQTTQVPDRTVSPLPNSNLLPV